MSLSAYLAKNYLNASSPSDLSARPKKRRKRDPSTSDPNPGLVIADDDLLLSASPQVRPKDDDDEGPILDSNIRSAEFRKSKKNNWKTLGALAPSDSEQAEADRILAAAAEEIDRARAAGEAEDAPAIVDDEAGTMRMSSGVRAGLQTAAETEAMLQEAERRKNAEAKAAKLNRKRNKVGPDQAEDTVYRDATGRRIDVSMKRAEARAAELQRLKQERQEKEDAMGEVQKRQKEERKEKLEEAKFLGVARHADDEEMNQELKAAIRWDDPMAAYMMKKQEDEGGERAKGRSITQGHGGEGPTRRRVYQGAAPPNRYGIKPGWRWDGVDRGNGFEKEWFQARGRKSRTENLEYQWQMDE